MKVRGLLILALLGALTALPAATVAFLGDSLTAGFGVAEQQAYPALIEAAFKKQQLPHRVINAGLSGDTSRGGLARLAALLKRKPDILVVALGANDGLNGLPLAQLEKNLDSILTRGKQAGCRLVIAGMLLPPDYGKDYREAFAQIFPKLAKKHEAVLHSFLLQDVAAVKSLNLADGMHPNAAGHEIMARHMLKTLMPMLSKQAP